MSASWHVPRRTFLKGLGASIALPMLDAMAPFSARAGEAVAQGDLPRRMAFIYIPNGVNMKEWTPDAKGDELRLSPILEPLSGVKDRLTVISGLTQQKAFANGDGPGDHARSVATFLTGCQAKKTAGADIQIGVSVDQIAAEQLASKTRFASLELGCEKGAQSGGCDSGYSCAYSTNLSWRTPNTPMPKEINPREAFERLFGDMKQDASAAVRSEREERRRSVLDFVLEDARDLNRRLGSSDQRKLEEYLHSVREVEARIALAEKTDASGAPRAVKPAGIPNEYAEHIRLMSDLIVLAFHADLTRVVTFMYANAGSNRPYRFIGVRDGHHNISHHGGDKEKLANIAKINRFHIEQLAYMLNRLKSIREGESNLLDQSMIVYGSGIGDGNRHNHDDLPILLAGAGGGTIPNLGKHLRLDRKTPMTNLCLSLLDRMDVRAEQIGDSTGRLFDAPAKMAS